MKQSQFLEVLDRDEAERRWREVVDASPLGIEEVVLEATREFNANNLDGAFLLDGGELKSLKTEVPQP